MLYDDGRVACDEDGLVIRRYYPWGAKRVPYDSIRGMRRRPLGTIRGRWRLWGSGDFKHWWNLDLGRPRKSVGLEIDVGGRVIPTITPDDPDAVQRVVAARLC